MEFSAPPGSRPFVRIMLGVALLAVVFLGAGSAAARAEGSPLAVATVYVASNGSDSNAGTESAPFRTIQKAAGLAGAGDTVVVRGGSYAGFQLGWDFPQSGMAGAPITFKADPGVVIEGRNGKTADGINLEGSSHVVIEGFTVNNASGNITRDCIRTVNGDHVVVRNNSVSNCNNVGIATSHSNHIRIEGNTTGFNNTGTGDHHGIYVANATVNPVVVGNTIRGNWGNGLHMNGDLSMGGNGLITGARVEGNVIHGNGRSGGSGINCDGVQRSLIRNNLLYDNHASGISLYRIDAADGAKDNSVVNNTVRMASDGRWAVNIKNASTGNTVSNNVLLHDGPRGAINTAGDSLPGLISNNNVVTDRFSRDDGANFITLTQWRSATGQDANSSVATPAALFADAAANDYHLSATSPALDAGSSLDAPATDIEGNARPSGAGYDVGAFEFGGTAAPPPATDVKPPVISSAQVSAARRSATVTWTTDETSTTVVRYGKTATYGKTKAGATGVRHSVTLTKLSAHTLYHYRVESEDASGNKATSTDLTFGTAR